MRATWSVFAAVVLAAVLVPAQASAYQQFWTTGPTGDASHPHCILDVRVIVIEGRLDPYVRQEGSVTEATIGYVPHGLFGGGLVIPVTAAADPAHVDVSLDTLVLFADITVAVDSDVHVEAFGCEAAVQEFVNCIIRTLSTGWGFFSDCGQWN